LRHYLEQLLYNSLKVNFAIVGTQGHLGSEGPWGRGESSKAGQGLGGLTGARAGGAPGLAWRNIYTQRG